MSEKGILKKLVDIFYYCEEIDNHLPKEEQTGYRMLPDIFYIKKEVHNLQQKVEQLESIKKEATEYINHATIGADSSPIEDSWLYNLYETRYILNKGDNNGK